MLKLCTFGRLPKCWIIFFVWQPAKITIGVFHFEQAARITKSEIMLAGCQNAESHFLFGNLPKLLLGFFIFASCQNYPVGNNFGRLPECWIAFSVWQPVKITMLCFHFVRLPSSFSSWKLTYFSIEDSFFQTFSIDFTYFVCWKNPPADHISPRWR